MSTAQMSGNYRVLSAVIRSRYNVICEIRLIKLKYKSIKNTS